MKTAMAVILFVFYMAAMAASPVVAQSNLQIFAPVYGNWCGPSHPVDMSRAGPPVDPLDAACMRHDYCVAAQGEYNCGCDISFLQELRSTRWQNPMIQRNARAIYDAIALVPCDTPDGMTYKQTMFAVDLFYDVMSGNAMPMDVFDRWRALLFGN